MKKYLLLLASAATVFAMASCNKDNKDDSKDSDVVNSRIKTYSLVGDGWADVYQYTYDNEGKVIKVYREESKQWAFKYEGNKVTITDAEGNEAYSITLGANGLAATMADQWDSQEYTYNSEGYMTQVKRNGSVTSNIIIEDGCITKWSRFVDGKEEQKIQTYSSRKNTAGAHNCYAEKQTGLSQWLMETGLFGKAPAYLMDSSKWENSPTSATYTYDFDESGRIVKEHKKYGEELEEFEYSWEDVK